MAIADDFTVALNGDIRYVGAGSTYYTVLELHRFLQGLADDAQASGSDLVDITSVDSSNRSTDNIITLLGSYNIDDDAAEQLYNGSITQGSGNTLTIYSGLIVVGAVESGTNLMIFRDNEKITSWWGSGINADAANNILMRTLIRTRGGTGKAGALIDGGRIRVVARELSDKYAEFSVTMGLGNSTAAIFTSNDLNNTTAEGTIASWTGITNVEGYQTINLNNGAGARPYYSQWNKDVYTINQLYERTKWIQRRGTSTTIHGMNGEYFRGITSQWDYDGKSGTINEDDLLGWGAYFAFNTGSGTFTDGEYVKIGTNNYKGKLAYYSGAGATGSMSIALEDTTQVIAGGDTVTGLSSAATCVINGSVTDNNKSGGQGVLLACDATDTMWVQVTSGVPPQDNMRIWSTNSDGYCAVNGSVTARTVNPEFLGQSTGTAILGTFGIGIEAADLTASDKLFDLTNTQQSPPNNQVFTVSGLVSGEDYVIVAKNDGADEIDYDQYTLNTTLNAPGQTTVVVTTSIASWTPATGYVRVKLDTGVFRRVAYTSWTGSTFTTGSTDWSDPNDATSGNNVFVGLIDKLADATTATFTGVYSSDQSLIGKVRDGGTTPIKPFKTPATFTSGGGGFAAIRTSDT